MGLDITAYSRLEHIGRHAIDPEESEGEAGPWCYYENHVNAFAYDCFPRSFRGIPIVGKLPGHDDFLDGGCFVITEATQTYEFGAGSYIGYGQWRQDLAAQFNPAELTLSSTGPTMAEPDPDKPFYELIWFADNEGSIGPEAAADLLADFREHADSYAPVRDELGYMRARYADWMKAFELAADGGLVRFH